MPTPDATDKILEILERTERERSTFEREVHGELRVMREEGRRRGERQERLEKELGNVTVAVGTALQGVKDLQRWRDEQIDAQRRRDSGVTRSLKSLNEEDTKHASDLTAVIIAGQETRTLVEESRREASARIDALERAIKGEAPPVQMREDGSTPPQRPELADPTLVTVAVQNERGIVLAEQAATAAKKGERVSRAQLVFAGITLVTIVAQIVERLLAR